MYIIEVIPITKGMGKDHLSYFTSDKVSPGALVSVPLRKKKVSAIVISRTSVKERKAGIKNSDFAMRKAEKIHTASFLDDNFIKAVYETARYFATTPGKVLNSTLPKAILENTDLLKKTKKKSGKRPLSHDSSSVTQEKFLLQTQPDDRLAHYKSLIREGFARQHSVFFCLPTIEDINKSRETLEKGIEKYTYILHSGLTKKEIVRIWNELIKEDHPVLIIATPLFLSLPRHDLSTIILERESASGYKQPSSPFLDMRTYAEFVSRERGVRFVLGDTLLRVETLRRYRNLEFTEYTPLKYRLLTSAETSLIDMRKEQQREQGDGEKKVFPILSRELNELIDHTWQNNERIFLFTTRRGLAPITICSDCGTPVTCTYCNNPVVLHEHKTDDDKNTFQCHKCGVRRSAHETCKTCDSWKLQPLGIGSERIIKEIERLHPNSSCFIIDKDHTRTHNQARKVINEFYQTPGSILVGTEMALLYLSEEIENNAVVSLDSLFSVPDFRINERIINILTSLRIKAQKQFMVQSRNADQPILYHGLSGNLIEFYREEISTRKQFAYPPFTVLIKITRQGAQRVVEKDMHRLQQAIGEENIAIYPASTPVVQGKYIMNGLVKIPREKWVDEKLLAFLQSLPPQFIIRVDPDSLL